MVQTSFHFRGTALGGFLVLEPWITPSLFYQFLGASKKFGDDAPNHVGLDSFTFCTALGKVEANKQLRRHWKSWVDDDQIANLMRTGVDTVRIPVGDWMYVPYEPYIGCMDGALDELVRVLDLCRKYNIKAVLDIHAMIGSQVRLHFPILIIFICSIKHSFLQSFLHLLLHSFFTLVSL